METPSHFLITASIAKAFPQVAIVKSAVLWGSVAPDWPLWGLSIGGLIYYRGMQGWSMEQAGSMMFDNLYFNHPLWLASHNLLHAPIILLIGLAFTWARERPLKRWLFWFFLSCLFHSLIDILTHVDDGPLIFFPLDWRTRFRSAISYYDSRYYGREFSIFERSLTLFCLLYLLYNPTTRFVRKLVKNLSK